MHYFAGIFDAEGWVSLTPQGRFIIGVEISHKQTVQSIQKIFGGKIYEPTRKSKKQVYSWRIVTNTIEAKRFLELMTPLCIVKKPQLEALNDYINQARATKRANRPDFIHKISELKKPISYTREQLTIEPTIEPDETFFKWLAGFMDGDGNFCVYEYQNLSNRSFDSWISIFNTFAEPILYVQQRIKGSISSYKGTNFPIWKWVANQSNSEFVCNSIEPYLIIKKEQCRLVSQYLAIHKTKQRGIDYSSEIRTKIQLIIQQIKHHNSL